MYIVNHFTLLPLNPFNLSVDREGWWCKQSVSLLWIWLLAESAQTFPSPSYVSSEDGVIWLWHLLVTLYQVFFHEYSRFDLYTYILHIYTYTVEKKENFAPPLDSELATSLNPLRIIYYGKLFLTFGLKK